MKKCDETMKEYPLLYRLWDMKIFLDQPFYVALGRGKIPSLPSLYRLRDVEIFRAFPYINSGPLYSLWDFIRSSKLLGLRKGEVRVGKI